MLYNQTMKNYKNFRFKFNSLIWFLLIVLLAISLVSVGLNIYSLILAVKNELGNVIIKAITLAINTILPVFTLSLMIYSKYVIKNGKVYCYFGFIRNKTQIEEIVQFTRFKKSDSLVAYFKDGKYTVIVIAPDKYDDFVKAVREFNGKITFDMQEEEN